VVIERAVCEQHDKSDNGGNAHRASLPAEI